MLSAETSNEPASNRVEVASFTNLGELSPARSGVPPAEINTPAKRVAIIRRMFHDSAGCAPGVKKKAGQPGLSIWEPQHQTDPHDPTNLSDSPTPEPSNVSKS